MRGTKNSITPKKGSVDNPRFEVHTFWSLSRAVGKHPTGLQQHYENGRIKVLASRIERGRTNLLVIPTEEIERLKNPMAFWEEETEAKRNRAKLREKARKKKAVLLAKEKQKKAEARELKRAIKEADKALRLRLKEEKKAEKETQ